MVVHAESQAAHVRVVEHLLVASWNVAVVVLIASEDVELLFVATQVRYLREHVVARLNAYGNGILANHGTLHGRVGGMGLGILDDVQLVGVAHIAIVGLSAYYPVPAVQRQVNRADGHRALHLVVGLAVALQVVGIGVVGRVAAVAAQAYAQPLRGVIVHTGSKAQLVGGLELEG